MEKMFITPELIEHLKSVQRCEYDPHGRELLNPVPMEVDVSLPKPLSLKERIQRILRTELSQQADAQGFETFEEANDFDVYDDFETPDPVTPYEEKFMHEEYPAAPEEVKNEVPDPKQSDSSNPVAPEVPADNQAGTPPHSQRREQQTS